MQQLIPENILFITLNTVGVIGVIMILFAYGLSQLEKISPKEYPYQFLNLFGSLFIMMSLIVSWNLPTFVIEVCWLAISIYGIYKIARSRNTSSPVSTEHSNE